VAELHLVRRRHSDYIHTSECRHATAGAVRWVWADRNPDVDWAKTAPWLKPCSRCKPPSPLSSAPANPSSTTRGGSR
jgi:hypothetical protein